MNRLLRSLVLLLPMLLTALAAPAAPLIGDAAVPFSADRTVVWRGKTYVGRMFAMPGRQRHEQMVNGLHPVAILRADERQAYLLLPEFKLYTVLAFPDAVAEEGGLGALGRPDGEDRLDGRTARRYHVHRDGGDGNAVDGQLWLDPHGILLRAAGNYLRPGRDPLPGSVELSHVVEAPQDPTLFEVPGGYTLVPENVLAGLFSLRLPGGH